jgi:DtxR family Mn-dependent transcriptional regulator
MFMMVNSISIEKMTPSKENYLKILLELSEDPKIRSSDVARVLGVTKASVSRMMHVLREEGYICMERYGAVTLTDKGLRQAAAVKSRFTLLRQFFTQILDVDETTAATDACRIEHIISDASMEKIRLQLINDVRRTGTMVRVGR